MAPEQVPKKKKTTHRLGFCDPYFAGEPHLPQKMRLDSALSQPLPSVLWVDS